MNNNPFEITPQKTAKGIIEMSRLMKCDYETVWKRYTHQLIKDSVKWEDVKPFLN